MERGGHDDENDYQAFERIDDGDAAGEFSETSDAVLDWNAIAVNTAAANKANPFAQGRFAAIVQVAVFEAVNSITGEYRPYLGTITGAPGASANAAAVEAAYEVLSAYFGASQSALDADRLASLGQPPYDQSDGRRGSWPRGCASPDRASSG
jgi:hypothetical protein